MKLREIRTLSLDDIDNSLSATELAICSSNLQYLLSDYAVLIETVSQIRLCKRIIFLMQRIIALDDSEQFSRKEILHNAAIILHRWAEALKKQAWPIVDDFKGYKYQWLLRDFYLYGLKIVNYVCQSLIPPSQRYLKINMKQRTKLMQCFPKIFQEDRVIQDIGRLKNQRITYQLMKNLQFRVAMAHPNIISESLRQFYSVFSTFTKLCLSGYEEGRSQMIEQAATHLSVVLELDIKMNLQRSKFQHSYEAAKVIQYLLTMFKVRSQNNLLKYLMCVEKYSETLKERVKMYRTLECLVDECSNALVLKEKRRANSQQKKHEQLYLSEKMKHRSNIIRIRNLSNTRVRNKSSSIEKVCERSQKNGLQLLKIRKNFNLYSQASTQRLNLQNCSKVRLRKAIESTANLTLNLNWSDAAKINNENIRIRHVNTRKSLNFELCMRDYEQKMKMTQASMWGVANRRSSKLELQQGNHMNILKL